MAIVQFRVDDNLKQKAVSIFEELGIDLSTALRMFLKRTVLSNGIPFPMIVDDKNSDKEAIDILHKWQQQSEENGNSEMTLDEINEIIAETRKQRKEK